MPQYPPGTKASLFSSAMPLILCFLVSLFYSILESELLTCKDQGQGGAQAIEDAVALGIVLVGATPDVLEKRLQIFEDIRRNRASVVTVFSNAGQDEPEKMHAEAAKFILAEDIPSMF